MVSELQHGKDFPNSSQASLTLGPCDPKNSKAPPLAKGKTCVKVADSKNGNEMPKGLMEGQTETHSETSILPST